MQEIATDMMLNGPVFQRRSALFHKYQAEIYCRTDGLFAKLMVLQWLAGIAAAFWISPKTWSGASSQTHWHVWAAIFLGGAISSFPVLLAWRQPGRILTRHTIAVAQMLTSALLIHLTGGRIETHFHVFGSLAFLAFYRDWRVLISATVVVAADHFLRGLYWPQSVYGVLVASPWRWFEHAGWVIFEDIFLCISIRQSISEMFEVATRQAKLEGLNEGIERQVTERTAELTATHRQLVEASRQAGMAEVATGVLHNVGNVLNSVNVTVALADEQLKKSRLSDLNRVVALLQEHQGHLASFLTADSKGQKIPDFLKQVAAKLTSEQSSLLNELESLRKNIEHIKDIVAMQQSYAKVSGLAERINVIDLVEDSLRLNAAALVRHNVQVIRDYHDVPPISIDKTRCCKS